VPPDDHSADETAAKLTLTEVLDGNRIPVELDAPEGGRPSQRQLVIWSLRRCGGAAKGRADGR
jgi:hypothetical protein